MYNYNVGKMIDLEKFKSDCASIRRQSPLVHCITNYVASEFNANALLALGASPIMSFCIEEMDELVSACSCLVINIGCVDSIQFDSMKRAVEAASRLGKPWVFDPVGAGASSFRQRCCKELLRLSPPAIIRGNASEIMALCGAACSSRGVDSTLESSKALSVAVGLAIESGSIVSVSGPTDYITDGERTECIANGSPLMTKVTAMGCTATALTAAFASVCDGVYLEAALNAMALMGVAGERAVALSRGTGSLKENFIDELSTFDAEVYAGLIRQQTI